MPEPARIADLSRVDARLAEFIQRLARAYQAAYVDMGLSLFALETVREQDRQDWLFAQGRDETCWDDLDSGVLWRAQRDRTGGARAFDWHPGPVATWTLESNHADGRAVDVGVMRAGLYLNGDQPVELMYYRWAWRLGMALATSGELPVRCLGPGRGDWGHYELVG